MSRPSTSYLTALLLGALLLSGCGEEQAVTATTETDSKPVQVTEEREEEVRVEPEKTPSLTQEPITEELLKSALVASSIRIEQTYYSQTGILVNPPDTTSSPITASGLKTGLVLFPHLNLEKQTISNNSKLLGENEVFSKIVYLSSQTSGPASQFEILKTSSRAGDRALSISTEPLQLKLGMGVTVYSATANIIPLTAAEEKLKGAKTDLTALRNEIRQFLSNLEPKRNSTSQMDRDFRLSRRPPTAYDPQARRSGLSLWDQETQFLKSPPGTLGADQYKEYRDLKNRLIAIRNLIPQSDPMMGPQFRGTPVFIGSGGSDRPKEWNLTQFKSEVIEVSNESGHAIIAAGPDGLPDALGFVVLGDNGHLLGLASKEEAGNLKLHSFEHLVGLNNPSVKSAEISISVSDENLVNPNVTPQTTLGLGGWESMWIAMVPTEEKLSFPAGDGADAIFNPTDKSSNLHIENISQNYQSKIKFDSETPIQPGTKTSFTGQVFAKSSDGNEFYFDPFTFEVESAAIGRAFDIKMVSGPAYAKVKIPDISEEKTSSRNSSKNTEELIENAPPTVIDFEGSLLASHLNGSRDILTIQTNAPPFIQTVNLKTQTKSGVSFKIPDANSETLTAVSGNHLFVVTPKTASAQKFELTTGKLLSESNFGNFDNPIVAIAAASSNAASPLMIATSHRIGLFSPDNLEELSPTLSTKRSGSIIQDNTIHIPQPDKIDSDDTQSYSAEVSADGLSYLFISSKNSRRETTIFMQPNANHSAFSLTDAEVSDDLGFNGYMLRRQTAVKTGIEGKSTRIKSKHTVSVSNKGGEGYFSITNQTYLSSDYPAPPATLGFHYIGNENPVFLSNLFPELKFFTRKNTTGKNVIFNPSTNQLITIPNVGGQLFIRNLSEKISAQGEFLFTTSKNINIERGEKLEILISSIGKAESIEKTDSPSNSSFNPDTNLFTWNIPNDFSRNETEVVFNAKIANGSDVEHRIKIDLTGTPPAVISRGLPYNSEKSAPDFNAELPQFGEAGLAVPLDSEFSKFIPTASGAKAVITYFNTPRIDLIDLSKGEISISATLSSDVAMVTANHEAVFCYYPFHQIIERRNALTLEIEKTAVLNLKAPLRVFKTGYQSRDAAPIIGITDTSSTRERDHQLVFINPVELTRESPTVGADNLTRNLRSMKNIPISVSEKGDRFIFQNQIFQINGTVTTELLKLQSASNSGDASISSNVDAVFINEQQYLIPSSTKISRKIRDLEHFNFSSTGDYIFGYGLNVKSTSGRKALIEFFEPFRTDPLISIYRLPELEQNPESRPKWDNGKYNDLVFHFESINKLITLPRDHRSIVIRDLNIPEAIKKLK